MVRACLTKSRSLLVAVSALVVATACQADFRVDVVVDEDGSGIVMTEIVLDAGATEGLADLQSDATLLLNDLAQAGWDVVPPTATPEGGTRITAQKAFGTTEQFAEVMDELSGPGGTFQGFALRRDQSFGRVDYALTGAIDPTGRFEAFSDPDLETALGRSLGAIAVAPPYETALEDITFTMTASLPGELQEDGSNGRITEGEGRIEGAWDVDLAGQRIDVSLQSARRSTAAQVLRGVAVVAAVLAALVAFGQLLRIFGARRRRFQEERARALRQAARPADARGRPAEAKGRPAEAKGRRPEAAPEEVEGADPEVAERAAGYRVVALDGMGVLYREGDDIRKLLVPFARERGARAGPEEIVDKARLLSLGRLTPADFWKAIGVEGDPNELDAAYLARHQLAPGVVRYLRRLRDGGIRVACITNDSAAWAMKLRTGHSLDGLIDPWVVSGSVGVRKPDQPLFEVLRRVTGEPPSAILVIDDDLDNLDVARDLGFGTRWFSRDGERSEARGHEIMRSFEGFNPVDTLDVVVEDRPPVEDRGE